MKPPHDHLRKITWPEVLKTSQQQMQQKGKLVDVQGASSSTTGLLHSQKEIANSLPAHNDAFVS